MVASPAPIRVLSTSLCPWLEDPLARLERARASGHLTHGWLLAGPSGIGKINLALVMAECLLRPDAKAVETLTRSAATAAMAARHEPCDHHPDLHWLFPMQEQDRREKGKDRRTIGIEQVRDATGWLRLTSLSSHAKVVIVEPAEAMTLAAANALLKTLEEPTSQTYLFLVSHQPGRLPATIRSRCQLLPIPRPPRETALRWLTEGGNADAARGWERLLALAEGAPLQAVLLYQADYLNKSSKLENQLGMISRQEVDAQSVADEWAREDLELALTWLATRLQWAIRARMAPSARNPVTDLQVDTLHNAWQALTLGSLFDRLHSTETLLGQIAKGIKINSDLALRVLLLGFRPRRGES
jgi:DNA polymerase-3 subunit delta'